MTEGNLFRTALVALGSTILVPAVVALTGAGAPEGKTTSTLVKDYIATVSKADDKAKNETNNKTTTQSQEAAKPASSQAETTAPSANGTATAGAKKAGTYTVKEGDTYGCIAEKYYGSYDQWSRVYADNAGWPGYDEYSLAVGAVLQMPAVSADEALPQTNLCQ